MTKKDYLMYVYRNYIKNADIDNKEYELFEKFIKTNVHTKWCSHSGKYRDFYIIAKSGKSQMNKADLDYVKNYLHNEIKYDYYAFIERYGD